MKIVPFSSYSYTVCDTFVLFYNKRLSDTATPTFTSNCVTP